MTVHPRDTGNGSRRGAEAQSDALRRSAPLRENQRGQPTPESPSIDRSTPPLSSLFQQLILEHYKRPRNRGELPDADRRVHMNNPTCGDEVWLQVRMEGDRLGELRFLGEGCSISQSSISMMTELLRGKTREEAAQLARRFTDLMHGDAAAAKDRSLGDLRALAGVAKFPVRVKCALLGWNALEELLRAGAAE